MSDHSGHNSLPPEPDDAAERLRLRNAESRRGMAEREAKRQQQHEEAGEAGSLIGALEFVAGLFGGKGGEGRDASGRRVVWVKGKPQYAEEEGIDVTEWLRRKE